MLNKKLFLLTQLMITVTSTTALAGTLYETKPATNIGKYSAQLNGYAASTIGLSGEIFHFGTTTSYGSATMASPQGVNGPVDATISNLQCNTVYHFKFVGDPKPPRTTLQGQDLTFTTLPCDPVNQLPIGYLDGISNSYTAYGWALDLPSNAQVNVQFEIDSQIQDNITTSVLRPDVNAVFNVSGDHGFDWQIPTQFLDGQPHTLNVLAQDDITGDYINLVHSGMSFVNNTFSNNPVNQTLTVDGVDFAWSNDGPINNMVCTHINEGAEPSEHTWNDNYFCSSVDIGLSWNSAGPLANMDCTQIEESADPHTWHDNYLCLPQNANFKLNWKSYGDKNNQNLQWLEPSDPDTWNDNYLTITGQTVITPTSASFNGNSYTSADKLIDGSGLTGVGEVLSQSHFYYNDSNNFKGPALEIVNNPIELDLGGLTQLSQIHIWNYTHNLAFYIERDAREVDVSLSTDGVNYTQPTRITLAGSGNDPEYVQSFDLTGKATHVRIQVVTGYGATNTHGQEFGLGEVRFSGIQ